MEKTRARVVEDEFLVRWDLSSRLEDAGYDIVEAGSAAEAISILESDREIRVVFTDVQMPGAMDGLALARYVRERWPPTIIVISSGNFPSDMHDIPKDCALFGKPFDWQEWPALLRGIEKRLS